MIENAILWVPPAEFLKKPRRIGGLSILERQLYTLSRAGLRRIWISTETPDATLKPMRLPAGLELTWISRAATAPADYAAPYLAVSGGHFLRTETLAHIARLPPAGRIAFLDAHQTCVVQVVPAQREDVPAERNQSLPEGSSWALAGPTEDAAALDWLMGVGIKSQDGFMARYFDRHLSLAISRVLLDTPVSPNIMTLFSCVVGLVGTAFFLIHKETAHLAGAALVWLHSVLDGCDGELARIRFQESPWGAEIDFWGDNVVHLSLFACLALGFARADASVVPLVGGAVTIVGVVGSAILVHGRRQKNNVQAPSAEPPNEYSPWTRLIVLLEQRDFIYLLLFLAYLSWYYNSLRYTYAFMWAGVVGTLLFFAMIIRIGRTNREQQFQPDHAS